MYSGKTTVGLKLSRRLGYGFVDLDQLFEARFHTSIPIFFAHYGEEAFRILERQVLHNTEEMEDAVISTGGGTACQFDNMEWMNAHGLTIYLQMNPETLLQRAAVSRKQRPLLTQMTAEERDLFVRKQLAERIPFYRQAQITLPADEVDLEQLVATLNVPTSCPSDGKAR